MILLDPAHLWLGLFAALPVVFHLIRRINPPQVDFALFRLLREAQQRARRGLRLERWLLLALRIALILLLSLWAARPCFLRSLASSEQPGHYLLLLDESLSMRLRMDGVDLFRRALTEARSFIGELKPQDRVAWLRRADETVQWLAPGECLTQLEDARPGWDRYLLAPMLEAAGRVLAACHGPRRILLLSDAQASSMLETLPSLPPGITLSIADLRGDDFIPRQCQYGDLRLTPAEPSVGQNCRVELFLQAAGIRSARFLLRLDGRDEARQDVVFDEEGRATLHFDLRPTREGVLSGEISRLDGEDDLPEDDRVYFTLRVRADLYGLIVGARRESSGFFVAAALDPREAQADGIRLLHCTAASLPASFDALDFILLDSPPADAGLAARIEEFLQRGGQVVLLVDRVADLAAFSRVWNRVLPAPLRELPAPVDQARSLLQIIDRDGSHPLFRPYSDPRYRLDDFRFFRCAQLVTGELVRDASILASFAPGLPALVERSFAGGRLLLFTAGFERQDSDAPFSLQFVPFVQGWKNVLRRETRQLETKDLRIGERPQIRLAADRLEAAALLDPAGRNLPLQTRTADGRIYLTAAALEQPGIHRIVVRSGGQEMQEGLACNIDPRERDLTRGKLPAGIKTAGDKLSRTVPVEWNHQLLYLAALFLLGETLLLWRLDEDAA